MVVFEGIAVHKRHNEEKTYQVEIPLDEVQFFSPLRTVNRALRKDEEYSDFTAVHLPTCLGMKVE